MKKVFIVLPSLELVSPIKAAFALIKSLYKDYEITIISINSEINKNSIKEKLIDLNIEFIYLNSNGIKNILKGYYQFNKFLRNHKPDLIISFLLRADLIVGFSYTSAIKISSIRNMVGELYILSFGKFIGALFGFFHEQALKKFDKLILISSDMKQYFIDNNYPKDKLALIHNFLDEPDVIEKLNDNIIYPFKNEFVTLVTISSLIKAKNISFIIQNALELLDRGYRFNVLIIGHGDQKVYLENMVNKSDYKDFFVFTGHIENPLPYLKISDIFVMASLSEGVSRSLMEALYLGKICIVSDIDGNRELIENGKNGYLFKNDDEFKKIIIENLQKNKEYKLENLLPYSFSYENGIKQTKRLLIEESK